VLDPLQVSCDLERGGQVAEKRSKHPESEETHRDEIIRILNEFILANIQQGQPWLVMYPAPPHRLRVYLPLIPRFPAMLGEPATIGIAEQKQPGQTPLDKNR